MIRLQKTQISLKRNINNNSLKKIILKLTGLKLIGSALGLLYSILQVRYFGASGEVDAFFIASSSVYLITSLIQGGQLSEVFLPIYLNQKKENGNKIAHLLLSAVITRLLVFVGIALIILYFFAPLVIQITGPGLTAEYKELSVNLFYLSLPLVLLILITSFTNTTLNAEQIYGRAEATALISSIISTSLLILFYKEFGVYVLVYSLLIGKIVEFIITLFYLKKIGYRYRFVWFLKEYDVTAFFKVMLTTSGYVLATQFNVTLMMAMASYLPTGSISLYNYVQQLSSKASNILIGPISTVFFSKFSKIVTEGKKELENYIKKPFEIIVFIFFIIFCFIFLIGNELLHFLWSSKSLTLDEFKIAYYMLSLNFLALIFSNSGQIFRKVSISLGYGKHLYKRWTIFQLFSAIGTFTFIYFFGIYGLIVFPIVNMLLMSSVSFYIARKGGINSKKMIHDLLLNKKFIVFVSLTFISIVLIRYGFDFLKTQNIIMIALKSLSLSFILCVFLFLTYKNEIRELISNINK